MKTENLRKEILGIRRRREERVEKEFVRDKDEEKVLMESKMDEKQAIHVNLISQAEMKAHTKEMRDEMDTKLANCLMVAGLDTREAYRRVKVWNAKEGRY